MFDREEDLLSLYTINLTNFYMKRNDLRANWFRSEVKLASWSLQQITTQII